MGQPIDQYSSHISQSSAVTQSPTEELPNLNPQSSSNHEESTETTISMTIPSQALTVTQSSEVSHTSTDTPSLSKSPQADEAAEIPDSLVNTEIPQNIRPFLDDSSSSSGPPSPEDDPEYNPRAAKKAKTAKTAKTYKAKKTKAPAKKKDSAL